MTKLTKIGMFWNAMGNIEQLIKAWRPEDCKTESEFEKSLYDFFIENSEGVEVVRQYGHGRARVDIAVGGNVFIEAKLDLNTTAKFHQLVGQVETYVKKGLHNIIIVLCGSSDGGLVRDLESHFAQADGGILSSEPDIRIVKK